ncbi:MAG: hypothetical protein WD601_07055 [Pseudohongiellaceae bacterium]
MPDKTEAEKSAEQTLITLDQLSQTLEVMTCVVERLKQHLNRQVSLTAELFDDGEETRAAEQRQVAQNTCELQQDSLIVEITERELEDGVDPVKH